MGSCADSTGPRPLSPCDHPRPGTCPTLSSAHERGRPCIDDPEVASLNDCHPKPVGAHRPHPPRCVCASYAFNLGTEDVGVTGRNAQSRTADRSAPSENGIRNGYFCPLRIPSARLTVWTSRRAVSLSASELERVRQMDRYCGQCGQAAVDDAQFCMSCGDRISPADPTPRPATVALRESGQISSAEPDFRPAAVSSHRGQLTDPPQRYAAVRRLRG